MSKLSRIALTLLIVYSTFFVAISLHLHTQQDSLSVECKLCSVSHSSQLMTMVWQFVAILCGVGFVHLELRTHAATRVQTLRTGRSPPR